MADIRINSLPTTASASSSDDFLALDGATNGTRKLNAYSPTFGGNLTVSGTGNSSVAGNLGIGETSPVVPLHVKTTGTGTGDFDNAIATLRSTAAGRTITLQFSDTTNQSYISSKSGALNFGVGGATLGMSLSSGGNLTVSGTGTSSVAGNLALNGATSYLAISPTTAVTNNVALQLSVDVADNRAIRMTNTASGGHAYDFIPGGGGDAGSLGLYDNTAGSYRLFISGTGNATLSGNLTVSGTVAASGDLKLGVAQTSQFSANRFSIINSSTNNQKVSYELMVNDGTDNNRLAMFVDDNAHTLGFDTGTSNGNYNGLSFSIEGSPKLLIDRSGNVLIGTTVDSSALLQVGTNTTTAAGGMKFGTDTSLYRSAAGQLRGPSSFVDATFSSSGLFFGASMTLQANDNVLIKTNGSVTALTLDSSQNATFAGTILTATNAAKNAIVARYNSSNSLFGVTVNSAGQGVISENNDASTGSDKYSKTGLPAFRLGNTGGSGTVPFWIDVAASGTAGNAITWTNAFQIDSSQNATFAGNVVLGAGKRVAYSASAYMTPENNVDGAEIASPGQFTVKTASTQALKIDSSQNATFAGNIASASKYDNTGTTSIAGSSTATIYTFPNASNKVYLVTVRQQGSAANNAMAMVFTNGTSASVTRIAQDNTNASLTIDFSFSGLSLQVTPGSGYGTTTWERTITNIK